MRGPLWLICIGVVLAGVLTACGAGPAAAQVADDVGRFGAQLIRQADNAPEGGFVLRTTDDLARGRAVRDITLDVPAPVVDDPAVAIRQRVVDLVEPHAEGVTPSVLREDGKPRAMPTIW
jgi:hypothetical protein